MALLNRTIATTPPKAARARRGSSAAKARVAPKTSGARLQLMPLLLVAASAVIVLGLLRIVQTSQATSASFAMQTLQQEKLELETGVRQLEAEVATLSSLERIEREAERLGLELPVTVSHTTVAAVWPAAADDLLPARFAPATEEDAATADASADDVSVDDAAIAGADGSSDDAEWWQKLLNSLPFQ